MIHISHRFPGQISIIKMFSRFLLSVYVNVLLLHAMILCINFTFYLGEQNMKQTILCTLNLMSCKTFVWKTNKSKSFHQSIQ